MYKFKIGENARKHQGECSLCLKQNVYWSELHQWGMCGACYAMLLEDVIKNIASEAIEFQYIYDGVKPGDRLKVHTDEEILNYTLKHIQAMLDKYGIKREKAEQGWVPGME
jgi:hypothetical protein